MDVVKNSFSYIKRLFIVFLIGALTYNIPWLIIANFFGYDTVLKMKAICVVSLIEVPILIGLIVLFGKHMVDKAYVDTPSSKNEKIIMAIVSIAIVIMCAISFWRLFGLTIESIQNRDYMIEGIKQTRTGYEYARDKIAKTAQDKAFYQEGVETNQGAIDNYDPMMISCIILSIVVIISTGVLIIFVIKKLR